MPPHFSISCLDAELQQRTNRDEWDRILVLRDHPRFVRGVVRYGELMCEYFAQNIMLNKVVTEAWRFQMLVYALHLYDRHDTADPATGLNLANLSRICARQEIASRGRVRAILGLMQMANYLERRRSGDDARVVHLEPSAAFKDIVEGWNQRVLQSIDVVDETAGLARSHLADPRFGWKMRERGAQVLLAGWKPLEPFPEVRHFVHSDGGLMLLLHCAAEALRPGDGATISPVALDLGAFGVRYGVSRSHLRRLLESAHAIGLLDAPPSNGRVIILSPRLVASLIAYLASELGNYRLWAIATQRELRPHGRANDASRRTSGRQFA